jgi:phage-related protein
MQWTVEFLNQNIEAQLAAQPKDIIASFLRVVSLIEFGGPTSVHEPYVKHLEGKIWEMRLKGKDGIVRAAYVTAHEKRVVVVHVFSKKTKKTPRREILLALKRAKDVKS